MKNQKDKDNKIENLEIAEKGEKGEEQMDNEKNIEIERKKKMETIKEEQKQIEEGQLSDSAEEDNIVEFMTHKNPITAYFVKEEILADSKDEMMEKVDQLIKLRSEWENEELKDFLEKIKKVKLNELSPREANKRGLQLICRTWALGSQLQQVQAKSALSVYWADQQAAMNRLENKLCALLKTLELEKDLKSNTVRAVAFSSSKWEKTVDKINGLRQSEDATLMTKRAIQKIMKINNSSSNTNSSSKQFSRSGKSSTDDSHRCRTITDDKIEEEDRIDNNDPFCGIVSAGEIDQETIEGVDSLMHYTEKNIKNPTNIEIKELNKNIRNNKNLDDNESKFRMEFKQKLQNTQSLPNIPNTERKDNKQSSVSCPIVIRIEGGTDSQQNNIRNKLTELEKTSNRDSETESYKTGERGYYDRPRPYALQRGRSGPRSFQGPRGGYGPPRGGRGSFRGRYRGGQGGYGPYFPSNRYSGATEMAPAMPPPPYYQQLAVTVPQITTQAGPPMRPSAVKPPSDGAEARRFSKSDKNGEKDGNSTRKRSRSPINCDRDHSRSRRSRSRHHDRHSGDKSGPKSRHQHGRD